MPVATTRRSQAERRQTTRAALLDAALEQLLAAGLAGFTTTEVCRRAGLSQGALFKHFDTKAVLLAAVTEHLFDELRGDYESSFIDLPADRRDVRTGVELLWDQMLDPRLAAAFELYTAARTDTDLRAALEPVVAAHVERIHALAGALVPDVDAEQRRGAVDLALLAMQGLVVQQMALPDTDQEARLRHLLDGLSAVLLNPSGPGGGVMDDLKNPAVLAVPLYFALIWWEVRALKRMKADGKDVLGYEKRDTWASILVGLVSLATVGVLNYIVKLLSEWLWEYRLTDLGNGVLGWAVALLGWDFMYYWLHRSEHESRVLWSAHVNHHSSERYNLSTALRQPWTPVVLILLLPAARPHRGASVDDRRRRWFQPRLPVSGSTPRRSASCRRGSSSCSTHRRTTGSTTAASSSTSTATTVGCSSSGTACSARSRPRVNGSATASPRTSTRTTSGRSSTTRWWRWAAT